MPERQDFGQVIKEARKTRGWTQADLADRLAISTTTISNLENDGPPAAWELGGIALELWRCCTCFGHARRVVKYGECWEHGKRRY